MTAQGMAARQGRDALAARREAQQPGPEGMRPELTVTECLTVIEIQRLEIDRLTRLLDQRSSAGFGYKAWREKPVEDRKAGAQHQMPGATE